MFSLIFMIYYKNKWIHSDHFYMINLSSYLRDFQKKLKCKIYLSVILSTVKIQNFMKLFKRACCHYKCLRSTDKQWFFTGNSSIFIQIIKINYREMMKVIFLVYKKPINIVVCETILETILEWLNFSRNHIKVTYKP